MSDSIKLHTVDLFSRFFQENQEKFLTFAYSYLRDKAEAEDVLMESMIALWENRNRWEEGSNLHALLLTIIKNKSLNLLEHKKIRLQAEENINSHNQRELNLRISTLKACEPEQIFDNENTAHRSQGLRANATTKPDYFHAEPLPESPQQTNCRATACFTENRRSAYHQSPPHTAIGVERLPGFHTSLSNKSIFSEKSFLF